MSSFWYAYDMASEMLGSDYRAYEIFSPTHFIILGTLALVCTLLALFYRKADTEHRDKALKVIAVLMLIDELLKYIATIPTGQWSWSFLPLHLCSIDIFVCVWYAFTKNKLAEQILYALCLPGASIALLTPTWLGLPAWNMLSLHSASIHMLLVLFPILVLAGGLKPDFRFLPKIMGLMILFCIPIYFVNQWLGSNYFFLRTPDGNPILEMLASILGEKLFFLGLPVLLITAWFFMYLPWEIIRYKNAKKAL